MNRKQRLLVYVAAGLLTGLVVAGIALYTVSRTEFGMERVRRYALGWLTERVDGTVHIGRLGGRGLLGGVTVTDLYIIDKKGRPFMRADSATLAYNWRTLVAGKIVIDRATLYDPEIYFEQLPGDSVWNYQHVFPPRGTEGAPPGPRRLVMLNNTRIVNGLAIVRVPYETPADAANAKQDELREVIDTVPGGFAKRVRFDSIYGNISRFVWESPSEPGKLIDIRSMRARGFVWRDPMHVTDMRGTVTLRDTIVAFDIPDARFPSSRASLVGRVIQVEGSNFFDVRVDSRNFVFRDMKWLYPRLPDNGGGSGVLRIQSQRPRGVLWLATDTRIAAPGTRVAGDFGVVTGADSLYFTNVNLRASPLNLDLVQKMLPARLPLDGLLVGTVEVRGGLSSLQTRGDVQLASNGSKSTVKWRGTFDLDGPLGARDFHADVTQLDLALLTALRPELKLRGQVTGRVEASGNVNRSVQFAADLHHYLFGYTSSFNGRGTWTGGSEPGLDVQLNAQPLSLHELAKWYPALERLQGDASGPIRLYGALDDMTLEADLQTRGGRAKLNGKLMRAGERPRYAGDATLYSFRLDQLVDRLPETTLDGVVTFDVSGTSVDDAAGTISARASSGRISSVDFRDAQTAMTLERGTARVDTFAARTFLGDVTATGQLGLSAARPSNIAFQLRTDSLAPLDSSRANTAGRVRAGGRITGALGAFQLDGNLNITHLRYGAMTSEFLNATLKGNALGSDSGRVELRGRADSVIAFGEKVDTAAFALVYANGGGDARVHSGSSAGKEWVAGAGFRYRNDGGLLLTLRELRLGQRASPWLLSNAVTIGIDDHGMSADSLEIAREDGGRVRAFGRIAWHDASHAPEGALSDFRLDFTGVPFTEFALVTAGASDVQGTLEGHVRVAGTAGAPVLDGDARVNGFAIRNAALDRFGGSFTYADQRINARFDGEMDGRRVFLADGVIPVDLAFLPVDRRRLDQPLHFSMRADSLPATFLTAMVGGFSDVRGRVDGTLVAGGTTAEPKLGGAVTLKDGNATWDVTGVRYRNVEATMRLESDRVARLDAKLQANGGSANGTGTIDFARLSNPKFDLGVRAQDFLMARRRDADLTASGNVQLRGHYRQPELTGVISVDKGALYLDELYRRYQIIDLDNPLLYDVVDTSIVALRTIITRTQSPFVKNLVVNDLRVEVAREAWLRSRDLNVEVSGDLTIAFLLSDTLAGGERTADDLILTGSLRAVRGTYQLYYPGISKQFSIRDGTVDFPGTPGVDPNLAFNAVYRARPSGSRSDPIDIIAVVGGTLRRPSVRLTSDEEPPISDSDLASYLFFGVPTYQLTSSQSQAVTQATTGLISNFGFGYLTSSLQNVVQKLGFLDYVALTAVESEPGLSTETGVASLFAGQRLELGRYLGPNSNLYIAYSQPLRTTRYTPGMRVEWRVLPTVTVEGFWEDRFARNPDFGLENTSTAKRVYGLFLYREWGY